MPAKFQEMLKEQRLNPVTSRAGLKWEASEDKTLLEKVEEGISFEEIAKLLQRTEGSIKTRLITYAIGKIENFNESIEDVSATVKISVEDIQDYQQKKKLRDEKRLNKVFNKTARQNQNQNQHTTHQYSQSKNQVSLSDIHALLIDIKSELAKLTG
jgi:hypothetical protein